MEAALLLPILMVCVALLVQPACLLYTRCVMQSAAAEGCRLLATLDARGSPEPSCEDYVLHRLEAVPQVGIFCMGDWLVEFEGGPDDGRVGVEIACHARPLPLIGVVAAMLGPLDADGCVELKVSVGRPAGPSWVEGDYGEWTSVWEM